ncbi:MAG: hypothetical protein ACJAX4_001252 [Clostridium sp.]|jgi:hypothetical protein
MKLLNEKYDEINILTFEEMISDLRLFEEFDSKH